METIMVSPEGKVTTNDGYILLVILPIPEGTVPIADDNHINLTDNFGNIIYDYE